MSAPTSYRPAFAGIARTLAMRGARDKDVAAALGVHPKTVQAWKRRHPDLAAALGGRRAAKDVGLFARATGRDLAVEAVIVAGEVRRQPSIEHVPASQPAMVAWLTGRRPDRWRRPPRAGAERRRQARRPPAGVAAAAPTSAPAVCRPARPGVSRYRPGYDAEAETLAAAGALDRDLAFVFDVHRGTLRQWRRSHPSFDAAIVRGKALADDRVEQALFRRATGYTIGGAPDHARFRHVRPSESAAIFWLANRRPDRWRGERETVPLCDPPAERDERADPARNAEGDVAAIGGSPAASCSRGAGSRSKPWPKDGGGGPRSDDACWQPVARPMTPSTGCGGSAPRSGEDPDPVPHASIDRLPRQGGGRDRHPSRLPRAAPGSRFPMPAVSV